MMKPIDSPIVKMADCSLINSEGTAAFVMKDKLIMDGFTQVELHEFYLKCYRTTSFSVLQHKDSTFTMFRIEIIRNAVESLIKFMDKEKDRYETFWDFIRGCTIYYKEKYPLILEFSDKFINTDKKRQCIIIAPMITDEDLNMQISKIVGEPYG